MKPNFKDINIKQVSASKVVGPNNADWQTPELIDVKPIYTKEDLKGMEHLDYVSGIPPFLRGPYSAMYPLRPWTIRQYPVRKVCPSLLTSRPTAATTPITCVS